MHLQYVANVKNNSYWQEITKQFTVEKLRSTKVIAFREIKCGKYFRILANVIGNYLTALKLPTKAAWLVYLYS